MKTKLFISTFFTSPQNELHVFCAQQDWDLCAQSFIRFNGISASPKRDFDVIFFSSPRSYNYYISFNKLPIQKEIAVLGKGTANQLNEHISSISFIGKNSGKPEEIAEDFKLWLGKRTVLFPISTQSNRTISSVIPDEQKEELPVYETQLDSVKIPDFDVYVFTSPSNVASFLLCNEIAKNGKVIAWGTTTATYLIKNNIAVFSVLKESSLAELVSVLATL